LGRFKLMCKMKTRQQKLVSCIVISKDVGQVNIPRELWVCFLYVTNCWNRIYSCPVLGHRNVGWLKSRVKTFWRRDKNMCLAIWFPYKQAVSSKRWKRSQHFNQITLRCNINQFIGPLACNSFSKRFLISKS